MGSSISAIYDDYDDYEHFCKHLGVETVYLGSKRNGKSFYDHQRELLQELGFNHIMDYYAMLRKAEERDKRIDEILE